MSKIDLIVRAPCSDGSGYSTASRNMLLELHKSDKFNISLENFLGSGITANLDPSTTDILNRMIKNKLDKSKACLFQVSVAQQFLNDCKWNVGFSVFETNRVPFSWVIPSNKMDAICVPSHQNKQAFGDSGITRPIHVVPHGIESLADVPLSPFQSFSDGKFNFLFVGTPQYRKGLDLAIQCYLEEFKDSGNTRLILKLYLEKNYFDQELLNIKKSVLEARNKTNNHTSEINIIAEYLSDEHIYRLYRTADTLLMPSRGEGFGLCGSSAASCGVPIIATNWSGPAEYLNNDIAYMIDYKMVPVTNMQFNPQFMIAQMEGHLWAEPDASHFKRLMREVYNNPLKAREKGVLAARHMRDNFTWDSAGKKLIEVIEGVVNQ